jgi:hypothetical protein
MTNRASGLFTVFPLSKVRSYFAGLALPTDTTQLVLIFGKLND